jgi:peptidoglycan/LPS O-acetylase OafA/YrhL
MGMLHSRTLNTVPEGRMGSCQVAGCDGIRAIACLMVFWYHALWRFGNPPIDCVGLDGRQLVRTMDSGVCIFFVLSGMLLSLPYWRAIFDSSPWPSSWPYLIRRVARIVPAYYAILVVLYLLNPGTYSLKGMTDLALHATFLHTFIDFSYHSVNPVLWSIGIEFQFYLLLPSIMAGMAGVSRTRLGTAGACGLLCLATWGLGAGEHFVLPRIPSPLAYGRLQTSETILWYLQYFAPGICAGMVVASRRVADTAVPERKSEFMATLGVAIAALAFIAISYLGDEGGWRTVGRFAWPANVATIAAALACMPRSRICQAALSSHVLGFLGVVSYGLYLWHWPVQIAVAGGSLAGRLSGITLVGVAGMMALLVSVIFASLSYYIVELPGQNALRSFRWRLPIFVATRDVLATDRQAPVAKTTIGER